MHSSTQHVLCLDFPWNSGYVKNNLFNCHMYPGLDLHMSCCMCLWRPPGMWAMGSSHSLRCESMHSTHCASVFLKICFLTECSSVLFSLGKHDLAGAGNRASPRSRWRRRRGRLRPPGPSGTSGSSRRAPTPSGTTSSHARASSSTARCARRDPRVAVLAEVRE